MKRTTKKLELKPQVIRDLLVTDLRAIVGGLKPPVPDECTKRLTGCYGTDYCSD